MGCAMTLTKTGALVGRPPGKGRGETPMIGLRLPPDMIEEIDGLKGEIGDDRSAVVRALVEIGLKSMRRRKARRKK